MTLEEILQVDIDLEYRWKQKFVVAQAVIHSTGESKIFIRGRIRGGHSDIASRFMNVEMVKAEHAGLPYPEIEIMGGGQINISADEKIIAVSEKSERFGKEPDRNLTIQLIKSTHPEFSVIEDQS